MTAAHKFIPRKVSHVFLRRERAQSKQKYHSSSGAFNQTLIFIELLHIDTGAVPNFQFITIFNVNVFSTALLHTNLVCSGQRNHTILTVTGLFPIFTMKYNVLSRTMSDFA